MKKILYFAAMAALLLVSCNQDEPKINEPEKKTDAFTFKASIEDLATSGNAGSSSNVAKATINGSYGLNWATGDKIGIYVNDPSWNDKNQPFTLSSGAGTTEGEFAWDETGEFSSNAAAAFFPWEGKGDDKNHVHEGTMYFRLRDSYYSYESGKMLTPLVAPLTGSTDEIHFKHAGAAVMVTINNVPPRVHSLGMSVDGQQITGEYSINPANAGTATLSRVGDENLSQNTIWLNIWNGSESAWTFMYPVPELTKPKLSFQMYDENDILVWQKNLKAQASDLHRADVLVMPEISITPYKQFTKSAEWTFCGTINGKDAWASDIPMYTDGDICILKGITFKNGDEFKIRKDKDWSQAYPGSNYSVTEAGTKDVFFNISSKEITLKDSKCAYPASKVTLYFGINTGGGSGIALSSSTLAPGSEWPGLTLEEREYINGKWYYKHEVDGGTVWGKSISGVHIVGIGSWNTSSSTLEFNTIKTEYYFEATSGTTITQLDERPEEAAPASITIDGDMSDWDDVLGSTNGTITLKAASDATNLYFYIQRTSTPTTVWGGAGYVYVALDLDDNDATGDAVIWGTKKFEYYALLYPYIGSAETPAFSTSPGSSANPSPYTTVSNISLQGVESSGTVSYEFLIPRSDLPTVPSTPIVVKVMGNKEMAETSHTCKL